MLLEKNIELKDNSCCTAEIPMKSCYKKFSKFCVLNKIFSISIQNSFKCSEPSKVHSTGNPRLSFSLKISPLEGGSRALNARERSQRSRWKESRVIMAGETEKKTPTEGIFDRRQKLFLIRKELQSSLKMAACRWQILDPFLAGLKITCRKIEVIKKLHLFLWIIHRKIIFLWSVLHMI